MIHYFTQSTEKERSSRKGTVVLLHGIGANSWVMSRLAGRLRQERYGVENWGYWSVRKSLRDLVDWFSQRIVPLHEALPEGQRLHIVAHSMGAIIVRAAVAQLELRSLSRIVMLSPPNSGSHVATGFGTRLRWLCPAVEELADLPDSYVNCLPRSLGAEVGIIASQTDRMIHEGSTHLDCEADHMSLPAGHGELIFCPDAARQVTHFLDHGRFHRADCLECVPQRVMEIA